MKVIEPELYLFELLSSPIKDYLKQRKDTMRWIVTTILSEEDQNLKDDLGKQYIKSYNNKDNNYDYLSSDEDLESAEKWEPQKFSESKLIIRNKNADIISTLVNIFGSPEKFMEQYKRMLAERCVSEDNFLLENEIKNLLLLKRKFGETLLHGCDIIIKDFKDSLRINNLIQKTSHVQDEFNLKCLIINKNFWPFKDTSLFDIKECEEDNTSPIGGKPILRTEKFDSHLNKLDTKFEKYKKEYMKHKFSRTLDFYTNLGYVDLTLQFENCEVKFRVTPLAAVLIKLFDEDLIPDESTQRKLDLDALSEKLKCNPNTLKKKLNFWVNSGVLTEMTNSYSTEEGSNYYVPNKIYKNLAGVSKIITEEDIFLFEYIAENENPMNLENAIVSIIRNSGPKNFEQIYKTLCFSYQITISEIKLRDLLGKMILDQKIFKEGEHYKFIIQST